MKMSVEEVRENVEVPVTILGLDGELDGSNFKDLIDKARELKADGTSDLLLDLTGLQFISSAGLVSLHSMALLMRGETLPDLEQGWEVIHSMSRDRDRAEAKEAHFKLFNPQEKIRRNLEMVGFDAFFEIHADREAALASFG